MIIPPKIILIWTGSKDAIPDGFVRETPLDGKFPKGVGIGDQNVSGGSNSHSHTSPTHNHKISDHVHSYTLANAGGDTDDCGSGPGRTINGSHGHGTSYTNSTSDSYSSSTALSYGSVTGNSLPPYYEVIFIKSDAYNGAPENIIGLFNDIVANLPDGWNICDGNNSTPDLRGKHLRGAASSQNPGTIGGSLTHGHVMDHSHSSGAYHYHGTTSASSDSGGLPPDNGGNNDVRNDHSHTFNTDSAYATIGSYVGTNTLSDSVEPFHRKLHAIMRAEDAGPANGLIGLFTGDIGDLPAGWIICDGENGTPDLSEHYVKIANNDGELGATAGSNTHTHAASSHQHAAAAGHTHTGNSNGHTRTGSIEGAGSDHTNRDINYTHPMQSVSSVAPLHDAANTTADSSNNEPDYLTALFVQYQFEVGGAAVLGLL